MKRLNLKIFLVAIIFITICIVFIQIYLQKKEINNYDQKLNIIQYNQSTVESKWTKGKDNNGVEIYFYEGNNYKIDK